MGKGSKPRPIPNRDLYNSEWDRIFNQKMKQKAVTELNWDGNEDRGRYGEDESTQNKISSNSVRSEQSISLKSSSR